MGKEKIGWEKYHSDCNELAEKLTSYKPDIIVPCMLGGLFPASIIAKKCEERLNEHSHPIDVRPISILRRENERWLGYDIQGEIAGKKILVVEDDVFTGLGFKFAVHLFKEKGAIVKTAALYITPLGKEYVDFWVTVYTDIPDYPWKKSYGGDRY